MNYKILVTLVVSLSLLFVTACSKPASDGGNVESDTKVTEKSDKQVVSNKVGLYSTFPAAWDISDNRYVFVKAPEEAGNPIEDGRKQLDGGVGITIGLSEKNAEGYTVKWLGTIIELFIVPAAQVEFYEANNWGNVTKGVTSDKWTVYYIIEDDTNPDVRGFIDEMELR